MITKLDDILYELREEFNKGICFINGDTDEFISYKELYKHALKMLYALKLAGVEEKSELVFQIDTPKKFVISFWACIFGNIIPVPIATGNHEDEDSKLKKVWRILNNPHIVFENDVYKVFCNKNRKWIEENKSKIHIFDELYTENDGMQLSQLETLVPKKDKDAIAFIQFSSGSTGAPKGVTLTHENLVTNILDIIKGAKLKSEESILSWMPLTHDMGMIGKHLTPMAAKMNEYLLPTQLFIRKPHIWLERVSKYRTEIISSPNFGYRFYLDHVKEDRIKNLDLSCVRLIFNGAEPISKEVAQEFLEKLSICGLKHNTMFPVYGLAEASLAVAFPKPGSEMESIIINRNTLKLGNKVEINSEKTKDDIELVCVGNSLQNVTVRILNQDGKEVEDGIVGSIIIKGGNVTKRYYNDEETTRKVISPSGELNTGDIGFIKDKELYITGRQKDVIFVNGLNFYSHDLEHLAEQVEGIELGKVVALGNHNYETHQEEVIFFVLYRKKDLGSFLKIAEEIRKIIAQSIGINIKYVIPVAKIPKTTSGKVQRFELLQNYVQGEYNSVIDEITALQKSNYSLKISTEQELTKERIILTLVDIFDETLGYKINEFEKSLVELGVDSIKVIKVQKLIEDAFKIKVPVSVVFDYPTLNLLADYIYLQIDGTAHNKRIIPIEYEQTTSKNFDEQVAIIGIGCRFPGNADSPDVFWNNLINGIDCIDRIPLTRWNGNKHNNEDDSNENQYEVKDGGFIKGIDLFDNMFFGISPVEAVEMDPQQRILLEVAWESIENAGLDIKKLAKSRTANVIGISGHDYIEQTLDDNKQIGPYSFTGSMHSVASGRISYTFGLQGPSVTIDTACSSSLVAINQAILFLKDRQCDLALAGGVNLIISPKGYIGFTKLGALSKDGRCKSFDDSADGYVRSEGCAVIILKRLSDALRDNDNILAVVAGSAVNHDGKSSGLTVPNGLAQEEVIKQAIQKSNITAENIDYVEAHGAGTRIGDPQEVNALANVFAGRDKNNKLKIGTVKSNIGHAESAAGMAGVVKVVLSLQNKMIPPNLHYQTPNKLIQWNDIPIEVVDKPTPWEKRNEERIAGVSSFALSGTNAHLILKEAPKKERITKNNIRERACHILALSAKDSNALNDIKNDYINYMGKSTERVEDICYTANISRTAFDRRMSFVGENIDELVNNLSKYKTKDSIKDNKKRKDIVFLYTGQGCIYKNIGKELYDSSPVFKEALNKCDELFFKYIDQSILSVIYEENQEEKLREAIYSQPIIFSIEYALTELWKSLGINPTCVIGHSIGEYAAACEAGIFNLEDVVKVVATRGKLMCEAPEGRMVGVIASEEAVLNIIKDYDDVSIAAINGEENVTISGSNESIEQVIKQLKKARIFVEPLNISHAFHSVMMEPLVEKFKEQVQGIRTNNLNKTMIWMRDKDNLKPTDIEYWTSHIKEPVRFAEMIHELNRQEYVTYIEIGGTATLSGLGSQILINNKESLFLPSLRENKNAWRQMLESISCLYDNGIDFKWEALDKGLERNKVILPTYPFQRQSFWRGKKAINQKDLIYTIDWIEKQLEASSNIKLDESKFIIFADEQSLGTEVVKLIKKNGGYFVIVRAGDSFKKNDNTSYIVNPTSREDIKLLFREIGEEFISDSYILYLQGIDVVSNEQLTNDILKIEVEKMCSGLLAIMQELLLINLETKPKVWITTKDAQDLGDKTNYISVSPSVLWGFGREIDFEFPEYWGGLIDIDEDVLRNRCDLVLKEIVNKQNDQVVLRESKRYIAVMNKKSSLANIGEISISKDNAYIITGGLGDLGLTFADWLVQKGARKLVLNGRSEPSDKALSLIDKLTKEGATVKIIRGDIANNECVEEIKNYLKDNNINLSGIIHAAGTNKNVKFLEHSWDKFYDVLAPKVIGTWNLHEAFGEMELDFFLLFSSISSIFGSAGHVDYVIANNFLNTYALYRNKTMQNTVSINWGPWAEIGMGYREGTENLSLIGLNSTLPKDGIDLLELALINNIKVPYIADIDWNKYISFASDNQRNKLFQNIQNSIDGNANNFNSEKFLNELKAIPHYERKEMLIKHIQKLSAEILGFDDYVKVSVLIPLMEQGFDSLMAVKLRNEIYNLTQKEISVTFLFNYPTIEKAAEYILQNVLNLTETTVNDYEEAEIDIEKVGSKENESILDELEALINEM